MTERATGRKRERDEDDAPERENASIKSKATAKHANAFDKKTIALVYDFDGTLSPRPMQEYSFLPQLGIEPKAFWDECTLLAREQGADPLITYMHLMYKKAREKGLRIDRDDLVRQGADVALFPGVEAWFDEIAEYTRIRAESAGVEIRHYLVSSGLTEIIEGTTIRKHFHNVFASEYWFDAYELPFPKRVITDTGKTQYLFRINKGIEDLGESINAHMAEELRPIPFRNMIYFGDGETDVPSMALMRKSGGHAIAVHPEERGKGYDTCVELFRAGRVDFFAAADYRRGSDLFKRTCLLLDRILADIAVQEEAWDLGVAI
ncbi:HAD family hydrolase [Hyphomicrobium sp.]|uniref:HAD family hydrolase n=1 Tax=Hyphomicrobium sp. TaxID=82 RepID=UPI002B5563B2|nr:HAD family hydrolase [Hyphomicrobium sp.]HRN88048.1 HAD family hydrolase [Hyphomicrobium sp.]HRQ25687.1 HAD family hydrolase [Hyphomicrobium sp.]